MATDTISSYQIDSYNRLMAKNDRIDPDIQSDFEKLIQTGTLVAGAPTASPNELSPRIPSSAPIGQWDFFYDTSKFKLDTYQGPKPDLKVRFNVDTLVLEGDPLEFEQSDKRLEIDAGDIFGAGSSNKFELFKNASSLSTTGLKVSYDITPTTVNNGVNDPALFTLGEQLEIWGNAPTGLTQPFLIGSETFSSYVFKSRSSGSR